MMKFKVMYINLDLNEEEMMIVHSDSFEGAIKLARDMLLEGTEIIKAVSV